MICAGIFFMFNWMCFLWSCALHTAPTFLCGRKVKLRLTTKDTPKTSWFLDFQQKGAPLRSPQRRIELVEILKGNDCQGCFY